MTDSRSICVSASESVPFPFYGGVIVQWVWVCVCVRVCVPHLLYPFICCGHLGCFQVLAAVNSAAMDIEGPCVLLNYSFLRVSAQ